jgi:hypothetical protein
MMTIDNLDEMLQKAFDENSKICQQRGFQRRIGFGRKPALIRIHLANTWTRPGNPSTCDKIDEESMPGCSASCRLAASTVTSSCTSPPHINLPIALIRKRTWECGITKPPLRRSTSPTRSYGG